MSLAFRICDGRSTWGYPLSSARRALSSAGQSTCLTSPSETPGISRKPWSSGGFLVVGGEDKLSECACLGGRTCTLTCTLSSGVDAATLGAWVAPRPRASRPPSRPSREMTSRQQATITMPTAVGPIRLARTQRRFLQIRHEAGFGWNLPQKNPLLEEIERDLRQDLAGSVALSLFRRASVVWFTDRSVGLTHDPDDMESIERTPEMARAATALADALRREVNVDAVRDDAERHLDSAFLYRKPWAIHVGRRLKDSPDLPDQGFGRLAPLGVTSLGVVAPWLGFVPAAGLDKWFHWRVCDLPWTEGPQLDVHDLDIEVWVRPRFRAANKAVEMAAEGIKVPAATEAADDLPMLWLQAQSLEACDPLGVVLGSELRLAGEDGTSFPVQHVIPLHVVGSPWRGFLEGTPGLSELEEHDAYRLLCPFPKHLLPQFLSSSKELLHHFLVMADRGTFTPVDPWTFIEVPRWHVPARETREITYFKMDEQGCRAALTELALSAGNFDALAGPTNRAVDVYREVSRLLASASESISSLRPLPIDHTLLEDVEAGLSQVRRLIGDLVSGTLDSPARPRPDPILLPPPPPEPVSRSTGSPHRSRMPDGTVVSSRDERFAYNLAAAQEFYAANGHLRPAKKDRPRGVNLYQWLRNQELRIRKGTMEPEREEALRGLPGWTERMGGTRSAADEQGP